MGYSSLASGLISIGIGIYVITILFSTMGINSGMYPVLLSSMVPLVAMVVIVRSLARTASGETVEEVEEIEPESVAYGTQYRLGLVCKNCGTYGQFDLLVGYDVEEAIKDGNYRCKVCKSNKLVRFNQTNEVGLPNQ